MTIELELTRRNGEEGGWGQEEEVEGRKSKAADFLSRLSNKLTFK